MQKTAYLRAFLKVVLLQNALTEIYLFLPLVTVARTHDAHTLEAMVGSAPTSAGSKSAVLLLNDTATLKAPSKEKKEGAFRTHDIRVETLMVTYIVPPTERQNNASLG